MFLVIHLVNQSINNRLMARKLPAVKSRNYYYIEM